MTISTSASSTVFGGNGATTSFGFSWIAGTASNIVVTYTDATGAGTVLTQGAQYTLSLNTAAAGQIWGVGGSVTYPLSGAPLAAGTFLTVQRIVPISQLTSISNQGDFYPQAVERALDTLCMEIQQLGSALSRAILFNVADAGPFATLPPVAQRALQLLGFDASGNPIAAQPSSALVSSVMQGVVAASSISAADALLQVVQYLPSVTAVRFLASAAVPTTVYAEGYYAPGDSGGGSFTYVASDTTSTDNGGTILVDALGRRWHRETGGLPFSAKWFGAKGDNTTDDTTALQAWLNAVVAAKCAGYLPAGFYLVSSTLTISSTTASTVKLSGDGVFTAGALVPITGGSVIKTTSATADILHPTVDRFEMLDIGLTSSVARTAGNHLNLETPDTQIERCVFDAYFNGILAIGNTGTIRSCVFSNATVATGTGITINGFQGKLVLDDLLFIPPGATLQPAAGIVAQNCGAAQISNCDILQQGTGLQISPGTGQEVQLYCINNFFDTCRAGVGISPTGAGSVLRCHFIGCWASSAIQNGFVITNSGSATISGIHFIGCDGLNNGQSGLSIAGPGPILDVIVSGCTFSNNAGDGIAIGSGVSEFNLNNNTLFSNTGIGIIVNNGASDFYVVSQNMTIGNTGGAVLDGGTGINKFVGNNIT